MPHSLDFDWRTSSAHVLFLSLFLEPRTIEQVIEDMWERALGEILELACKRLMNDGALVEARSDAVNGAVVLHCSELGRRIVESYLDREKNQRTEVERKVVEALKEHAFQEASLLVSNFEATQVFPFRGWKNYNAATDKTILSDIFEYVPKRLRNLKPALIEQFRIAAGVDYLWEGESTLRIEDPIHLVKDEDAIFRMFQAHALYRYEIQECSRKGVKAVKIIASEDSCSTCQQLSSRKYEISQVPVLPHEECTSERGCYCWFTENAG